MGNGFLMSQLRRNDRNLLITNFVAFLFIVMFFLSKINFLYNAFRGPFQADFNWLGSITDPASEKKKYIEFKSPKVYNMWFHEVIEEYSSDTNTVQKTTVKSDYLLVGIDEKFIVVKVPHGMRGSTFIGEINELPGEVEDYAVEVMLEKGFSEKEIDEKFQPILVDTSRNYKAAGYTMIVIGSALLFFVLWNMFKIVKRNLDPYSHPVFTNLSKYGNNKEMAKYIENELEQGNAVKLEKFIITDNWIIYKTWSSLYILKISDLIWIYKRIITRRVNFIAVGKNFEIVLNNNRKGSRALKVSSENAADRVLEEIYKRAPWIIFDYNDEYRSLWARDFRQLVNLVEMRKAQILSSKSNMQNNNSEDFDMENTEL